MKDFIKVLKLLFWLEKTQHQQQLNLLNTTNAAGHYGGKHMLYVDDSHDASVAYISAAS